MWEGKSVDKGGSPGVCVGVEFGGGGCVARDVDGATLQTRWSITGFRGMDVLNKAHHYKNDCEVVQEGVDGGDCVQTRQRREGSEGEEGDRRDREVPHEFRDGDRQRSVRHLVEFVVFECWGREFRVPDVDV